MADPRLTLGLLILGLIASTLLVEASPQGRIYGGEDAVQGEFPWSVSVRYLKAHTCSGTIISETMIVTAAHCVSNGNTPVAASDVNVRVGSINQYAGGSIVNVKRILIHPSYGNFLHDIGMIELEQALTFSNLIQAITLPDSKVEGSGEEPGVEEEELPNGTPVYVAGWGELSSGAASFKLQKANYNTLSAPWCELEAGYGYDSVLCLSSAETQGICRGDAGAAVFDDDKVLRGITSFYFGDCGSKYPDVSARVSYYLEWIEANSQ
ncbi:hypothetical protein KR009_002519 [Drosophila setifemur]|nr:hypothetical protein KR009_002519 [Drosophila setifemur]